MLLWAVVGIAVVLAAVDIVRTVRRTAGPAPQAGIKIVERELPSRKLETRSLEADECKRYSEAWDAVQPRFVDDPEIALREIDRLLQSIMRECGYPTGDFGRINEEATREQLDVLEGYRAGHRITVKGETTMLEPSEIERARTGFQIVFDRLITASSVPRDRQASSASRL